MARILRIGLLLAALALVAWASAAEAHASYTTADGEYRMVIGHLNEPVYTYVKSGLDLSVQENTPERTAVATGVALEATLIAPSGAELTRPLQGQFGKPGAFTFDEGYVLTEPGQYQVRLRGNIAGSPVDGTYNVAGAIDDQATITFPDTHIPSPAGLRDNATALQAEVDLLEARIAALDDRKDNVIPGPMPALVLVGLALVVALRRR